MGERWRIDFSSDQQLDGWRFRVLTVVDRMSRGVWVEVDQSPPSQAVTEGVDRAIGTHGKPEAIAVDNETETSCNHFDRWAYHGAIHLDFITPGRPAEDGLIESFTGKLRDECPNLHWNGSLAEVRMEIEA